MAYVELKRGVSLLGLHPRMQVANATAAVIWLNHKQILVITEGVCDRDSGFHPLGRACDYRTYYFDPFTLDVVAAELAKELGTDYDVVVEDDHIHCEYDPTNPKII